MAPSESPDDRDRRIARLWQRLDTRREGKLDLAGLKKGLKRIDHPLKNADSMLHDVLVAVDTNGDGCIDYAEFKAFVNHTEAGLWQMFQNIDRNHNGEIDRHELRTAFARAGLTVSTSKLNRFFDQVDTNRDGVISYEEWRDFLLFLPAESPADLGAVVSYYTAVGNLNPEGDVHINDLQGLGTDHSFPRCSVLAAASLLCQAVQLSTCFLPIASAYAEAGAGAGAGDLDLAAALETELVDDPGGVGGEFDLEWLPVPRLVAIWMSFRYYEQKLTENTPQLGYFLAGGIAGVISRTATAPFDRLKVYLIAQTGARRKTGPAAARRDAPTLQAAETASKQLVDAVKALWRAGGIRSLFAGNGLNVLKVMPESAIKFGAYEAAKRTFARLEGHNNPKRLLPVSQFLSGGFGGMVAQCFVYPLDTLKFRIQCETVEGGLRGNRLISATAKKMWQTNGLYAFFRGLPLGIFGMFPYAAIDLSTFEYLKRALLARNARIQCCHEDDIHLNNFTTGAIGAVSGATGASVVYPLNVVRTRLQAQGTVLHPATYAGITDVARRTFQAEGIRGFYRGLTPNLLKVAPAVSISYIVYENSKRIIGLK